MLSRGLCVPLAGLLWLGLPGPAPAHVLWDGAGDRVSVSVELDGRRVPLYPAADGSDRAYIEARAGARYSVVLSNRTRERLGVALTVDGLSAISGRAEPPSGPRRMYVLQPWDTTVVRGWRTSLDAVQQFAFVDERGSYAARIGQASARIGWIEIAVFRERARCHEPAELGPYEPRARAQGEAESSPAPAAPEARSDAPRSSDGEHGRSGASRESFPGTGWGPHAYDPAVQVEFAAESRAVERLVLRYEYASGLRRLGILPLPSGWDRDRLRERERGEGFARPPAWE